MKTDDALNQARATVAAINAKKAKALAAEQRQQRVIASEQEKFGALKKQHAHLDQDLAEAERALCVAEEAALLDHNIALAGEIVRRNATDPVKHAEWIVEHVLRLRASVRSEWDTPINSKFSIHPLIRQCFALVPPLDPLDTPIDQLNNWGTLGWAHRRKTLLARYESEVNPPLEAA